MSAGMTRLLTLVLLCPLCRATLAEEREPSRPARTATVSAGPEYAAGGVHRLFFGSGYRELWTTPIEVEVLDLGGVSGGLTPYDTGGGKQTRSLKLKGADGREWRFRSIDKDPSAVLPHALRNSVAKSVARDQISASHPGNALVIDALSDAAHIPHVSRRVVVLADDPRLGQYREEFAGMLGTLEERLSVEAPVTPGFEGFSRRLDSDELAQQLDADPRERVDPRAFLKVRLFDAWIGDYDRHEKQWEWAKSRATGLWTAVPKDRDLAFVAFDGLVLDVARKKQPRLVDFGSGYPSILGLTWQARFLDRRHLAPLEWPAWQEVVAELQGQLSDAVIDDAVRRMPAPYYRLDGARLAARLKSRRGKLPEAARSFYALLARDAEVHATDQADALETERFPDGSLEVRLGAASGQVDYFVRRFLPGETDEVRVFLKGGDDRAATRGRGGPGVVLRVIGGEGNDLLDDSVGGHTRYYDTSGENNVIEGSGTVTSEAPYTSPRDRDGNPVRDWGASSAVVPWVRAGGDLGVLLGGSLVQTRYGFRQHPFAHRHSLRFGYSTGLAAVRAEYEYESMRTDSRERFALLARYSSLDLARFYGFGNETQAPGPESFYKVKQRQLSLAPSYRFALTPIDLSLAPVVKYSTTPPQDPTLATTLRPYGVGDFGQVGARLKLELDRRDHERAPRSGVRLMATGTFYPQAWSVEEPFGEAHASAALYATARIPVLEPTLALRVGGQRLWGRYPFHEAAFIGGPDTVRGLPRQRYAGEASLYGNAELRLTLIGEGTRLGIFGLADAGRVALEGDPSDLWHTGFGGGLWLSLGRPENTFSLSVASSEGNVRVYLESGFMF
jgi:hypothetical protein